MYVKYRFLTLLFWITIVSINSCKNAEASLNFSSSPHNLVAITDSVDKFYWQPITYAPDKRYIYLTFDDGPQNGTAACLELCKKLGIKATFFMVGQHANSIATKKIVYEIRESYPQILLCNHSTSHASGHYKFFYEHSHMAETDFMQAQQTLHVPYKIIRLPGNNAWVRDSVEKASQLVKPICMVLDSVGYKVVGWDVEWSFNHKTAFPVQSAEKMTAIIDSTLAKEKVHTKNHIVILMHDRMFREQPYLDSLSKLIATLQKDPKNVFETVDHYPGIMAHSGQMKTPPVIDARLLVQNLTKKKTPL